MGRVHHFFRSATVLVALQACTGSFDRLPRQDEAEAIVWCDYLGLCDRAPPPVFWADGCDDENGLRSHAALGSHLVVYRDGWCDNGLQRQYQGPDGWGDISRTAYVHESIHYAGWIWSCYRDANLQHHRTWTGRDWIVLESDIRVALARRGF